MRKIIILMISFLNLILMTNVLESQSSNFTEFWETFRKSVVARDESAIIKLTYFASKDEEDYFSFQLVFDDEAIKKFKTATMAELKKVSRTETDDENSPFVILELPKEVNEIFTLSVSYEDIEDEETIKYDKLYTFGIFGGKYLFLGNYTIE